MTKEEIAELKEFAEHFNGDLKKAAAAKVLGLGFVKMKRGIPKETSKSVRAEINKIYEEVSGVKKVAKVKPAAMIVTEVKPTPETNSTPAAKPKAKKATKLKTAAKPKKATKAKPAATENTETETTAENNQ